MFRKWRTTAADHLEKPRTLNQRLDQMGPHYRAVCGQLHRVLAITEAHASTDPPHMEHNTLELVIRLLSEVNTELQSSRTQPDQQTPA
jgi:hypothetical protein